MPDSHQPQSASIESGSKSSAARKGLFGHPGALVIAGIVVLLGANALGYLPHLGSLLKDSIRFSRSSDLTALGTAFYGIAGLAAFFILLGLLRSFDLLLRHFRATSPLKSRSVKPLEQFIEEAAAANISLRVARESYYLLEPQYPYRMCIDLSDDLRSDLLLPDEAIRALDALLRARCDRRQDSISATQNSPLDSRVRTLVSVFDLLQTAESAPPSREDRSGSRDRAGDGTGANPSRQRHLSDSAQRKALHAATLSAIEAGSLHTPDSSGPHRRFSDCGGPRRRATDHRSDAEYTGPYHRATDRARDSPQGRPSTSSPERMAQPAALSAELRPVDSVFALQQATRTPEQIR